MLLGEVLAQLGHASREQVDWALSLQRERGGYVGSILVAVGAITGDQLNVALRMQNELSGDESLAAAAAY